jgi:MGT family glycosyltransferase
MARFLFATMPVPGHVAPIAPVARRLVERGHTVVWYTSRFLQKEVEATGAAFRAINSTVDYGDSAYDVHFPERKRFTGLRQLVFDFEHLFVGAVEGYVKDLRAIAAEHQPDVLVTDPAVAAGWLLEQVDGLPMATINVTVLGLESRDTAPFGLGLPPSASRIGRIRNRALMWLVDHVIFRRVNRAYRVLAKRHAWPVAPFRPRAGRFLYLQPSIPELEYPISDLPPQVHFIGALLPDPPAQFSEPDWWPDVAAARAQGRSVVLVTQGTIATNPADLITPAMEGLASEDVLVVVAGADATTLGSVPANVRVARFVPFGLLMPMVDVYVTNGGFGGVMIALSHGVPVVSAGTSEDKAEVGARLGVAGVGINLKTRRPQPELVRNAVRKVLDDPKYRTRADTISRELADRDGPVLAVDLLEELAATHEPVLRPNPVD